MLFIVYMLHGDTYIQTWHKYPAYHMSAHTSASSCHGKCCCPILTRM